jgi:ppGpp synthetase/RelA/SpoT-type nucleotidyltranferase
MKIVTSIDEYYSKYHSLYVALKDQVDKVIKGNKKEDWHYKSRIKSRASFALKLETGRFDEATILHDFLGCTLVIENSTCLEQAISFIERHFNIEYQKPKDLTITLLDTSSFQFDDLRLYVSLKDIYDQRSPIFSLIFEIQIKTFLQHAWVIATHDLLYKSDTISWSRQRIGYQIKAMLEHAELSIQEVKSLSENKIFSKSNQKIINLNLISKILKENWEPAKLPDDIVRLSENVEKLLAVLGLSPAELEMILSIEQQLNRGAAINNLSPFLAILQSIIYQQQGLFETFLKTAPRKLKKKYYKLLLPPEIVFPSDSLSYNEINSPNIIKINKNALEIEIGETTEEAEL